MPVEPAPTLSSAYAVRLAQVADAPYLAQLAQKVFATAYGSAIPADVLRRYLAAALGITAFANDLANKQTHYLLAWNIPATLGPTVVGFSKLAVTEAPDGVVGQRPLELSKLYVHPLYHGQQVGALLLHHTLALTAQLGNDALWLCAWEGNPRALAFYRKWGFTSVGRQDIFVEYIVFHDYVLQIHLGNTATGIKKVYGDG